MHVLQRKAARAPVRSSHDASKIAIFDAHTHPTAIHAILDTAFHAAPIDSTAKPRHTALQPGYS